MTSFWRALSFGDADDILVALRVLVVGALGAGIAWCWFNDYEWAALAAPFAVALLGVVIAAMGDGVLPDHPVWAVRLMPWRILAPAAVATVAAGAVIVTTVELTLPDEPKPGAETKELVGALTTAVTAFLTAAFIAWAGDEKDSNLADWIRDRFQTHFTRRPDSGPVAKGVHYFAPESRGELLVYSDPVEGIAGWGRTARAKRARAIAEELRHGTSDPGPRPSAARVEN